MSNINIPVVNAGYLSVQDLQISVASNTTISMAAGQARDSSNVNDIVLPSAVTINAALPGAVNGMDTGVLVLSTLYAVYVIGDSTQNSAVGGLLSANLSTPLLPAGYDMYRLVGYVRTDASVHFLAGYWTGSSNERMFCYDAPIATAITAGAATTDTEVVLNTFVPPVAGLPVLINYAMTPAAASRVLTLKPYGATGAFYKATGQVAAVVLSGTAMVQAQLNAGAPSLEYLWSAGGGDAVALNVAGYLYTI